MLTAAVPGTGMKHFVVQLSSWQLVVGGRVMGQVKSRHWLLTLCDCYYNSHVFYVKKKQMICEHHGWHQG